jgi:hypothetical protein
MLADVTDSFVSRLSKLLSTILGHTHQNMTSLPFQLPPRLQNIPHVVSAYNICLRLEKSLQKVKNEAQDVGRNLILHSNLGVSCTVCAHRPRIENSRI